MLLLPERTDSFYKTKLLFAPDYKETYTFKDLSDAELLDKQNELEREKINEGYYNYDYSNRCMSLGTLDFVPFSKCKKQISFTSNSSLKNKKITFHYRDNKRCYCFNCKKFITAKVEEYECSTSGTSFQLTDLKKVYICPECGVSEDKNKMRYLDTPYTLFNECFLDGNKLRIKRKNLTFKQYNNHIFIENTLEVIVMNLDTGMTYKLPKMVNGKPRKRDKLRNITYENIFYFDYDDTRYSTKCKPFREILDKSFELIRQYKIEHNGYYIPTKQEQIDYALSNGKTVFDIYDLNIHDYESKTNFGSRKSKSSEDYYLYKDEFSLNNLIKFNRFPAMNIYLSNNFYDIRKDFNLEDLSYKKLKRLRGQVKQNESNPIKVLADKIGVPYSKTLRKVFNKNIKYMILYKSFMTKGIKRDNILKLLNIRSYNSFSSSNLNLLYKLDKAFPYLETMPTYNENNFINKIVRGCEKDRENYHFLSDALRSIVRIRTNEGCEDYVTDLRDDIKSLHDKVMSDERKIRTRNRTIEYEKDQLKVNGTFNGLHFALAKDTHELIDVGSTMNICVGGYGDRAINHSCYIVVARNNNNDPIICIEVDKDFIGLNQTKLRFNNHPSEDSVEYKAILEWCKHAKMLPINYEIEKYVESKQFLLDNKALVRRYNKDCMHYQKINLDQIKEDVVKRKVENVEEEDTLETLAI